MNPKNLHKIREKIWTLVPEWLSKSEDITWITVNGTHIPIGADGQQLGGPNISGGKGKPPKTGGKPSTSSTSKPSSGSTEKPSGSSIATRGHREVTTSINSIEGNREREKLIAADIGEEADSTKVRDIRSALNHYTCDNYGDIRNAQMGKNPDSSDKRKAQLIEQYISKAPKYDEPIFRGMVLPETINSKLKSGQRINMKGVSSWSSTGKVAEQFGNTIFVTSNVSRAVAISAFSHIKSEREVIVSSKSSFIIRSIKRVTRTTQPIKGTGEKPVSKIYTVVRVSEVNPAGKNSNKSLLCSLFDIKKNESASKEMTEKQKKKRIQDKIESDKHIEITDENGKVVYQY